MVHHEKFSGYTTYSNSSGGTCYTRNAASALPQLFSTLLSRSEDSDLLAFGSLHQAL
jgi:hypothetical protein